MMCGLFFIAVDRGGEPAELLFGFLYAHGTAQKDRSFDPFRAKIPKYPN
jgi:hypothetical protein